MKIFNNNNKKIKIDYRKEVQGISLKQKKNLFKLASFTFSYVSKNQVQTKNVTLGSNSVTNDLW